MSLYITGDCHGDFNKIYNFIEKYSLTENDAILVLGDMGLYWRKDKRDANFNINEYETFRDEMPQLWFIDGNHENFKLLKALPKNGYCSPHIKYISRGTIIEFAERKLLFIGGADSIDKHRRIEGLSWWADETITQEDIDAIPAGHYDYVFSHCCPYSIFKENAYRLITLANINQLDVNHASEDMLDKLKDKITFNHWYFGHYHIDHQMDDSRFYCLFNDFKEVI